MKIGYCHNIGGCRINGYIENISLFFLLKIEIVYTTVN